MIIAFMFILVSDCMKEWLLIVFIHTQFESKIFQIKSHDFRSLIPTFRDLLWYGRSLQLSQTLFSALGLQFQSLCPTSSLSTCFKYTVAVPSEQLLNLKCLHSYVCDYQKRNIDNICILSTILNLVCLPAYSHTIIQI